MKIYFEGVRCHEGVPCHVAGAALGAAGGARGAQGDARGPAPQPQRAAAGIHGQIRIDNSVPARLNVPSPYRHVLACIFSKGKT